MDFTCLFRQYNFILKLRLQIIKQTVIKGKKVSFDISLKNILGNGNVIIKVVTSNKKELSELSRIPD
jgi:hypothetical protein